MAEIFTVVNEQLPATTSKDTGLIYIYSKYNKYRRIGSPREPDLLLLLPINDLVHLVGIFSVDSQVSINI